MKKDVDSILVTLLSKALEPVVAKAVELAVKSELQQHLPALTMAQPKKENRLLNVKKAAALLSVAPSTV